MTSYDYEVVIIGTGPGGEGAAMMSAKAGKRVAVVERSGSVGGNCTHKGTIPSKALRHAVQRMVEFNRVSALADKSRRMEYPDLLKGAASVIASQATMRRSFYERNDVELYHGHARFADQHTLQVHHPDGAVTQLSGENFIIATGSKPYQPEDVDFEHARIFDSDSILSRLDHTPRSIIVYGAGVIGCEYASIFRAMGVYVNLVDSRSQLLSFLDDEIIHALSYYFRDQGVIIRHNEQYESVAAYDDHVILNLQSGKRIKADILLWANGRSGNTSGMGLEELGIVPNSRGQVAINDDYQTSVGHIYAVGDVIGYPSLASAAYDQGRFAATHFVEGQCDHRLIEHIPTGIYTSPEISSIGPTERELTKRKVPYEVGYSWFKSLARAQITGNTVGMLKLLFHRETLEILGIHCFGDQASEIVHIGQAVMAQQGDANSLLYFINTTFNYPTMAEAYRVAALNGLNRLS